MSAPSPNPPWANERPVAPMEAIGMLFEGIKLAFGEPQVRKEMLAGIVVNGLVFILVFGLLVWGAIGLVDALFAPEPGASGLLAWIAGLVVWLLRTMAVAGAVIIAPIVFSLVASIVLPVFNSKIFAAARAAAGGGPVTDEELATGASVALEIRRLLRGLGLMLVVLTVTLLLGFVPILNAITTPIGLALNFLLGAATLGWDLHAYHLDMHGLGYGQQRAYVKAHRSRVLAMGGVAMVLLMIPIIQILFIATNVSGAGILSAKLDPPAP